MIGLLHPTPLRLLRVMWESGLFLNCNVYWDCPTACRYCFSRLNRLSHKAVGRAPTDRALGAFNAVLNKAFGPRYDDSDPVQFFLHEGYPVMVSNNSDPLSALEVAHGYTLQYLHALADAGAPVNLLSKWQGWRDLDQDAYLSAFARFKRFWPSITITADNDAALAKWEPGAPSLDERFAIIRQLADAGHWVDVRVIPFLFTDSFPGGQWDDPATYRPFIERCAQAGARGIAVSPLDLSRFDAHACDACVKEYVAEHDWCSSAGDKAWRYWSPDLSMWEEVSRIWYAEIKAAGLQPGIHQCVNSIIAEEGDLACAVVGPEWHDLSLSWVRAAQRLRRAQRELGAPIVTTAAMVAEYTTRGHRHASHRFDWRHLRDLVPHPITNDDYNVKLLHKPDSGATFADIIRLQLDDITGWPDSLFADIATAPVTPVQGCGEQVYDDEEGVIVSYDAEQSRPTWAACCTRHGWDGRTITELRTATLVDGSSPWDREVLENA